MPRKGPAPRRELMPDPVYHSVLVTQVVNKILQRGKRTTAEKIVYRALEIVEQKAGTEPLGVLKRAIENVKPQLEVKSRRVAVPPTRSPSRSGPAGPTPSPSAGSSPSPAAGARRRWPNGWPTRCSTPPTASAPP